MAQPTHYQTHNAGRLLAVAEALLRGYDAKIDGPRTYVKVNGQRVQVQVAAKGAWQIDDVDKYTSATIETAVLVNVTDGVREFYICPGDDLRAGVRHRHDAFVTAQGGQRPRNPDSKHSAIYPQHVADWHDDWNRLA
jgi:hypothetical protein